MSPFDPRRTVFMRHALERMDLRGISKAEVQAVLSKPTIDYPAKWKPGVRILGATVKGREIRCVVGFNARGYPCVITAWAPDGPGVEVEST